MPRFVQVFSLVTACVLFVGCSRSNTIEVPTKPVQPDPNDKPVGIGPGSNGGQGDPTIGGMGKMKNQKK